MEICFCLVFQVFILFFSFLLDTWIYTLVSDHITHFFGSCCLETEKFRASLHFFSREHSVQTANDNNKATSQVLETTLILFIFKLVLPFHSGFISEQIKYYITTNRGKI